MNGWEGVQGGGRCRDSFLNGMRINSGEGPPGQSEGMLISPAFWFQPCGFLRAGGVQACLSVLWFLSYLPYEIKCLEEWGYGL